MSNPPQNANSSGNSTPSLFTNLGSIGTTGQSRAPSSGLFSSAGQAPLFGSSATQPGGFGALGQANTASVFGGGGSSVGGVSNTASSGFGFGTNTATSQGTAQSDLFNGLNTPAKTAATSQAPASLLGGGLGGISTPPSSKPSFAFSSVSTTPAGPPPNGASGLFNLNTSLKSGAFGEAGKNKPSPTTASLFGGDSAQTKSTNSTTPSALFSLGDRSASPNPFGSTQQPAGQATTAEAQKATAFTLATNPLGSMTDTTGNGTGAAFAFPSRTNASDATASTAGSSLFAAPASATPSGTSLFAGLGQAKSSSEQPASSTASMFPSLTSTQARASSSTSAATTAGDTSRATTGTTAAPSLSISAFGAFGKTTGEGQQKGLSTTQAGTSSAALGSSTAGPAPNSQSRLKNKSMDDIITRWASDLSKYQKEFQAQAEKVASWDRMLLENGNAISKLYSKTFQAERDTAEVQRQLSSVEGQQDELAEWLDRYEQEVDEMMARQVGPGEGLQGPDQDRERTYKSAERISDRLQDMSKDLTSMIDEINAASATISNTSKPDDPVSQIVRILNGHLSQLQSIDQGTAALQAKVAAAQKDSQRLGSRNLGGYDAADDFYRSYMSRG